MEPRPSVSDNITRGLQDFTPAKVLALFLTLIAAAGIMALAMFLESEEELFIAPWWMRGVQALMIVGGVLLQIQIAKALPATISRYTGQLSRTSGSPILAFIFFCGFSHPLIWGGLHHLHPGQAFATTATVTASGGRHGRAAQGHGDWADLRFDGQQSTTRVETDATHAMDSGYDGKPSYECSLEDTRPGDIVQLRGTRSSLGFAIQQFIPQNERLLTNCQPKPYR